MCFDVEEFLGKNEKSKSKKVTRTLIPTFPSTASIASSLAVPFDYYNDEFTGNSINAKEIASLQSNAITSDNEDYNYHDSGRFDAIKRDPELFVGGQKRNIISALRAKIRRSKPTEDVEDKFRFSPVLSVGELRRKHESLA